MSESVRSKTTDVKVSPRTDPKKSRLFLTISRPAVRPASGAMTQGKRCAGRNAVDASLRAPRRPHADTRYEPTREAAMAAFAKSWRRE
jgi:hypothetical protein